VEAGDFLIVMGQDDLAMLQELLADPPIRAEQRR
jgi:hypothetical protein